MSGASIVERLRVEVDQWTADPTYDARFEAADTIEKLVAALDLLYRKTVIGTDAERHAALDNAGTLLAKVQS